MNIRFFSIGVLLLVLSAAMPAMAADGDDTPLLREAAARRYLAVVPVQKMIDDIGGWN